ncbi:MAG: COR domain-containing protein [Cytophagales bacterium]|nr:COR domain-containing protein [Cytophagales bacterium]
MDALRLIEKEKQENSGKLDLGNCGLMEIPDEVFSLKHLHTLILSNQWWDWNQEIWVNSRNNGKPNHISKIDKKIDSLTNLIWLVISGGFGENWQISDLSPICGLLNLKHLDLSNNEIKDLKTLGQLVDLNFLYLRGNKIKDIHSLRGIQSLIHLDLHSNQIEDIAPIESLKDLRSLNIHSNHIQDLMPLKELINLSSLKLSNNRIEHISAVKNLSNLNMLDLSNNKIRDIEAIAQLTNINLLDLSNNKIQNISPLNKLVELKHLDLTSNKVQDISSLKMIIQKGVKIATSGYRIGINLNGNPLTSPPLEIVKQGNQAILGYFESLERSKNAGEGTASLRELKLVLVGEGASGKTSLLKQLQGKEFDPKESQTHGINIARMRLNELPDFQNMNELEEVVLHGWDFGGQEIMHASHQIFLTKRAIYIYVIDSRNDSKKDYWLQHIRRYGDGSPSLVAINKIDLNPNYDLERSTLNKKYPFLSQRFFRISCKEGNGLKSLKKAIGRLIPYTELYGMQVAKSWVLVKKSLEIATEKSNYLSRAQFLELCNAKGIKNANEQNTLLQFLHDLGIVFHFKALKLKDFYVLDPHWVTVAVYKIMNTQSVRDGILKERQLNFILNHEVSEVEEYDPAEKEFEYNPEEQRYLVEIMAEFELLYELGNSQYLIPDLLPKESKSAFKTPNSECLHFVLEYDFLAQSLFNRLVIARNEDIKERQWLARNQVVFDNETCSCRALVLFDLDSKIITIQVWGREKRNYLAILRDALYQIHQNFYSLKIHQKLPVPGHSEHFVDYDELIGLEQMGQQSVSVGILRKSFAIADFLDPIISKHERQEKGDNKITRREHGDIIFNLKQEQSVEQNTDVKTTVSISIQIQNLLGETESLKEDIEDERELLEEHVAPKEIDVAVKDIEKAEKAIAEIEQASKSQQPVAQKSRNRLKRFVDDLSDEDSPTHKTLKALRKGKDYAVNLAEMYNGVAENIGVPLVPKVILGVLKKL